MKKVQANPAVSSHPITTIINYLLTTLMIVVASYFVSLLGQLTLSHHLVSDATTTNHATLTPYETPTKPTATLSTTYTNSAGSTISIHQNTSNTTLASRSTTPASSNTVLASQTTNSTPVYDHLTINGQIIPLSTAANPELEDAGTGAKVYNGQYYYGHNSGAVFGQLQNLPVGATFTITKNGQTTTYAIAKKVNLCYYDQTDPTRFTPDCTYTRSINQYRNALYRATYLGQSYSIALQTCSGANYYHDDGSLNNTHRLVVLANVVNR